MPKKNPGRIAQPYRGSADRQSRLEDNLRWESLHPHSNEENPGRRAAMNRGSARQYLADRRRAI
jgi:hypothetical protein